MMPLTILEVIKFTFLIVFISLLSLVIYAVWLIKKKMLEKGTIFFEIFTWLLYCNVSLEAYALMFCIFSIFALDPSTNIIFTIIFHIPLAIFIVFIFEIARNVWRTIEEYGLT